MAIHKTAETTTRIVLGESGGAVTHTTAEVSHVQVHLNSGGTKNLTLRALDELIYALREIRTCLPGCSLDNGPHGRDGGT